MKVVFNLILVALAAAAGWYLQPDVVNWMAARKEAAKKAFDATVQAAIDAKADGSRPSSKNKDGGPSKNDISSAASDLAANMRKNSSRPSDSAATPSMDNGDQGNSQGSMVSTPSSNAAPAADEIEVRYPLPSFKSIEEITKEWSSIPSRAFPRPVKTLVPIVFESPAGKVKLPENSDALAVGMTQGMLVLMRSREDSARSLVPLANTDLKQSLTVLYDKFKAYKIEEVRKQRQRAKDLKSRSNGATAQEMAAAGPKPKVDENGVILAMMQSLRAKEIKETTPEKIISWGPLNVEEIGGKAYWTGTLQCTVDNAIFGPIPTELLALIKDEKVVKWLYSGSREEVQ